MRTFIALLLTCVAASAQIANSPAYRYNAQFCNQSLQFFNRLATKPTFARKQAYDRAIRELVTAGTWQKLDAFYLFAAADSTTAKLNLVTNAFNCGFTGAVKFTNDVGIASDNTTSVYVTTGFDPTSGTPNFTKNANSFFVWKAVNNTGCNGGLQGIESGNSYNEVYVPDGHWYYQSSGVAGPAPIVSTNTGCFNVVRSASNSFQGNLNGVTINTTVTGTTVAFTSGKTIQFLRDGAGNGSTSPLSAGGFGGALNGGDIRNIYTAITNYLADIAGTAKTAELERSSDIVLTGNNNSPGLSRLRDTRLFASYSVADGTSGGLLNGDIVYKLSSDQGATWSTATTIATHPSNMTYIDGDSKVISNGTVIRTFMQQTNALDGSFASAKLIIGTVASDLSISWGSIITPPTTMPHSFTTSYVLELQDGRLMYPFYDEGAGGKIHVSFSSDLGATWGNETAVINGSAPDAWSESNFIQLNSGTIIGFLRNDGVGRIGLYRTTSTDAGVSWSAPTLVIASSYFQEVARPAVCLTQAGTVFLVNRFIDPIVGNLQTGYTYSTDNGLTWATPKIYYTQGNKSYGQHIYASGFWDVYSQSVFYAIAQGTFAAAQIDFQQFYMP